MMPLSVAWDGVAGATVEVLLPEVVVSRLFLFASEVWEVPLASDGWTTLTGVAALVGEEVVAGDAPPFIKTEAALSDLAAPR